MLAWIQFESALHQFSLNTFQCWFWWGKFHRTKEVLLTALKKSLLAQFDWFPILSACLPTRFSDFLTKAFYGQPSESLNRNNRKETRRNWLAKKKSVELETVECVCWVDCHEFHTSDAFNRRNRLLSIHSQASSLHTVTQSAESEQQKKRSGRRNRGKEKEQRNFSRLSAESPESV